MNLNLQTVRGFFYRWGPPLVVMGVIYWWSAKSDLPGAGTPLVWWDFTIKKIAHMVEYSLLFYFWQRALNWNKSQGERSYRLSFLLVLLYAISDEFHQTLTPGRQARPADVGYDMLGSFLVYLRLKNFI